MSENQACDLLIEAIDEEPSGPLTKEGVELVRRGWERRKAELERELNEINARLGGVE